jgi:hypothetical protein
MSSGELFFLVLLCGVPLWLAARTWKRYFDMGSAAVMERPQMLVGLALATTSTVMWLAVFALILLQDRNGLLKTIAVNLSPAKIGLLNISLCAGGIICSRRRRSTAQQTLPLRKAIASSSGVLMLIWFVLLLNPH